MTFSRLLTPHLIRALKVSPIVFLNGPRQAGKSTLARSLTNESYPADYVSFDSAIQMAAAANAPQEFLQSRKLPLIIDEVQMVPTIFRTLKIVVDELRLKNNAAANGNFLLTGSANIMALPELSNPLVGRMSIMTLYPLCTAEIFGSKGSAIEQLFTQNFTSLAHQEVSLIEAMTQATFPELSRKPIDECTIWFDGYITTLLQRDVRMLAELEKLTILPHLLRALAARAGTLINEANIARDLGLNPVTTRNYHALLKMMFLTIDIKPWFRNINKRLVKAPKGYLVDTLLLCHLLDYQMETLSYKRPEIFGHIVENFVATELFKLLTFSKTRAQLWHFRTSDHKEIDFLLEKADGSIAAIEVKTSERVDINDFKGMQELQQHIKEDFICGIVLYQGQEVVPFGKKLWAVPFCWLWQ